jgi:hypothetical protein
LSEELLTTKTIEGILREHKGEWQWNWKSSILVAWMVGLKIRKSKRCTINTLQTVVVRNRDNSETEAFTLFASTIPLARISDYATMNIPAKIAGSTIL